MDRRAYALPAAVVPLTAAGVYLYRRHRHEVTPGEVTPDMQVTRVVDREGRCACGQQLRLSGEGRHTVFWTKDAAVSDPLLEPVCPSCGRDLLDQDLSAA